MDGVAAIARRAQNLLETRMAKLTHIGASGEARMVDVSDKPATERAAIAEGRVVMRRRDAGADPLRRRQEGRRARRGAHRRHHGGQADARADPALPSDRADQGRRRSRRPTRRCPASSCAPRPRRVGPTGVEMEALTAVAVACLTDLRHGQGGRPRHAHRGRAADREARRQVGPVARGEPRMSRAALIPVEEALARVLASAPEPLEEETSRSPTRFGRTLARDVAARRAQPPFANSAMDGYALRAADAARAPARLRVVGEVGGGPRLRRRARARRGGAHLHRRAAARRRRRGGDPGGGAARGRRGRRSPRRVAPGDHVRRARPRFRRGRDRCLPAGPAAYRRATSRSPPRPTTRRCRCAAARASPSSPPATNSPRPARRAGRRRSSPPTPSPSPASSRPRAASRSTSASPPTSPPRSPTASRAARRAKADVLVTLGGASVGDYDLVRKALADAGMALGFWRIAMRPGKPLIHGRLGAMQRARPARQPDLLDGLRACCSCGRCSARCSATPTPAPTPASRRGSPRPARHRRAQGLPARDARRRRRRGALATPIAVAGFLARQGARRAPTR